MGLKSSDSLKIISNMFKNAEHKGQPEKYKTNLLNHVNYVSPDFDRVIKTDIQLRVHSDGDLRLKVFKIFYSKKKKKAGRRGSDSSSQLNGAGNKDEETMLHKFGFSGMSALNDKFVFQKYRELLASAKHLDRTLNHKRLQHDIDVLKVLLERQKKVRTHGNIMTPTEYESAELDRMRCNIEALEQQISEMNSEASKQSKQNPAGNPPTENSSLGLRNQQNTSQTFQPNTKSQGNTEEDNSSALHKGGALPNVFQSPQLLPAPEGKSFGLSPDFTERRDATNDDKTGYDEDFDEEDSKSDLNPKKKQKARKEEDHKSRKQRENPRQDFVNDFFKQNLTPAALNAPSSSLRKAADMTSSKLKDTSSNLPKSSTPNEWQNDLLKNLQDKTKLKREQAQKQELEKDKLQETKDEGSDSSSAALGETLDDQKAELNSVKVALDDTGSVTSNTKTLMRQLQVLRYAMYENYSPQSIQNLKYSA